VARRGNNRPQRYEVPAQQWASLSDPHEPVGAAVLSDSKHGWDKPADNRLRHSLLHSPFSWRKYPHQRTQDFGTHRFTYALMGHRGDTDRAQVASQAASLNQPPIAFVAEASPGALGRCFSFLDLNGRRTRLGALKQSEAGDGYVVRLHDQSGAGAPDGRLTFPSDVLEVTELLGSEQPSRRSGATGMAERVEQPETAAGAGGAARRTIETALGSEALRTLKVRLAAPPEPLARPSQQPLDLPWDHQATSLNDSTARVDFDGQGHSLPGELLPGRIATGAVDFELGPATGNAPNALRCSGQEIALPNPPDGPRWLWLLATTTGAPVTTTFQAGEQSYDQRIASWTGWFSERPRPARWSGLVQARPGSLESDPLAWIGTHRHHWKQGATRDEPYVFCYLYRYRFCLPPGATSVRLPDEAAVRIFAATLSEPGALVRPALPLYGPLSGR
jgi:alpha-mannosidase